MTAARHAWAAWVLAFCGTCGVIRSQDLGIWRRLTSDDGGAGQGFGSRVAIDRDTIAVSAPGDNDQGFQSGAAYAYRLSAGGATSEVRLLVAEVEAHDRYGTSIAASGDVIVVGAPGDDDASDDAGAAYVFRWGGMTWVLEQKLVARQADTNREFGVEVAVSGDVIVVGEAHGSGGGPTNTGAAYVFRYDGARWGEEQKLTGSDSAAGDRFGEGLAVDGDVVLVGAQDNGVGGSVYVYEFDGTDWVESQKFTSTDIATADAFGADIAIDGATCVVGAQDDDDAGSWSGSAYIFGFDGMMWIEEQKLAANDAATQNFFGRSVAISDGRVVVGAHGNDSWLGAAYAFRYDGMDWILEDKLSELDGTGNDNDHFGWDVGVSRDVIAIGHPLEDSAGTATGAVYIYSISEELAGNPLGLYPFFEYVRAVHFGESVHLAVDPVLHPELAGEMGDLYVVAAKTLAEWTADRSLTDVRGAPQTVMFTMSDLQSNTFQLDAGSLAGPSDDKIGLGYDVVVDRNQDGMLDTQDLVDGFSDEAGFYVVRDVEEPGTHPVSEISYTGGMFLGQVTYYPSDIASLGEVPLIVVSHGNGHNYQWYDHIGEHMASYGYLVMSHENDTIPGVEEASTTTLTNTDYLLANQDTIAGGVLDGHIDSSRIIWIGHSRGAEGVVRAYDRIVDATYAPSEFDADDIRLVSSIAPTVFLDPTMSDPHEVDYHLWVGGADHDVTGGADLEIGQSYKLLERAAGRKAAITLHGAAHGDFHNRPPPMGSGGGLPYASLFAGPGSSPCPLGRPRTHRVMRGYLLPLVRHALQQDTDSEGFDPQGDDYDPASQDFLWRHWESFRPIGGPSGTCAVMVFEFQGEPTFVIDDYESGSATNVSSSGGVVTYTVSNLIEGLLDDNNATFAWTATDPMNGMTRAGSGEVTNGAVFDWDMPAEYEFEIVADGRDFRNDAFLSFRACQGTRHPKTVAALGNLTFGVTLRDSGGTESTISVGMTGAGIEEPYQRAGLGAGVGWGNELETIRIRLRDFLVNGSGLDLSSIAAVKFDFGGSGFSAEGRLGLDDVALTND